MTRSLTQPPTRRIVPVLVASAWLLAGIAQAADLPRLVPHLPPPSPTLALLDGGTLAGSLEDSAGPGMIRWKSAAFTRPLEFTVEGVQSIRYPAPEKLPQPEGSYGFELTGGDMLFGSILSLDDKFAELEVAKLGKVKVDRSRFRRIFRWKVGADLLYNGPNGLAGWREVLPFKKAANRNPQVVAFNVVGNAAPAAPAEPPPAPAADTKITSWTEEGGQLQTTKDGTKVQANVNLPARASLELDLSWKTTPDFIIALGVSDAEETVLRAFRLEVWDGQIVAVRSMENQADVVALQPLKEGPGRVQLQLFLDQEQGKLLIFSAGGESLASMKLGGQTGPGLPSIRITNVKGDIRLERLRIARWDGETPQLMGQNQARIQLADASNVQGLVDRFDPATREFVLKGESSESRIAEDKIATIFLAQPDEKTEQQAVRALYQDGTRVGGNWVKVEGGSVILDSPGITGPLPLPMVGLRSIEILRHEGKSIDQPAGTGTLELDGVRLLGRLVNSGDPAESGGLVWRPLASENASPIRPGASGRIIYKVPAPGPTPAQLEQKRLQRAAAARRAAQANPVAGFFSALGALPNPNGSGEQRSIYLRTGDIIPAEILKIDDKGITFKTDITPSGFVPHARVKAVELAAEQPATVRLTKIKMERLLTLPRMQRDSPPTQLIRSKNGDMLRGRIVAMDDKTIRLEIRLDEKDIPRDRVSKIIWLHADETDPSKKVVEPPEKAATNRVQAVRSDGIRLTFLAERFADDTLFGKSDILGDCKVRMQDLDQLLIGGSVEKEATQLAYQNWKLSNAPDPKAESEEAGGSGSAGTESALVGKPAPDFELELLGGKKFHLADKKGTVIVLDFWATWCGPCLQAMPQIDRVTHEFADKGVELIAVNLQESPDKIKAMLERQKLSPTVALDRDGVVAARYAANAIPQTVVIDRDGKVTRLFIGGGPKLGDQLREALQSLMPVAKP